MKAKASSSQTNKGHSNYWQLSEVEKGPLISENTILSNMSISMALALARSFSIQSKLGQLHISVFPAGF